MRILVSLVMIMLLSGCTAMLVSGSATTDRTNECEESDKKEQGREC